MAIEVRREQLERMEQHGIEVYPEECCGVLLGKEQDGRKVVLDLLPLKNARADSPHNRFLILPEDFLRSEREARARGMDILGFYHSHPDHPARPSEYDREHAWPWYTYLILAVEKGRPRVTTGWLLSDDRMKFLPEEMTVSSGGNYSVGKISRLGYDNRKKVNQTVCAASALRGLPPDHRRSVPTQSPRLHCRGSQDPLPRSIPG